MASLLLGTVLFCYTLTTLAGSFTLVKEYSGSTFFDDWDYYGNYDNLTGGAVNYVSKTDSANLTFLNSAGNAIVKLDNTTNVPYPDKRNSVRITSQQYFGVGTLWVVDALHIPWGCSVWPGLWTTGDNWPQNGEIDIIEGINQMTFNQMAIHTGDTCQILPGAKETGNLTQTNCTLAQGCSVEETTPDSYGQAFANNGGGIFAAQWDVSGIFIWFWPRANVPQELKTVTNSLDISSWPTPSVSFVTSASCNISNVIGAQKLVIDITLCGSWADAPGVYAQTCGDSGPNACYVDNVINSGNPQYANAYFELASIRAFSVNGTNTVFNGSTGASPAGTPSTASSNTPSPSSIGQVNTNGVAQLLPMRSLALSPVLFPVFMLLLG